MSKERLLAAIMFTDITGYTALMGNDEDTAINIRERHRSIFEKTTFSYNGKIVQYFGDGTLSIFTSAAEAVQCGIAMQKAYLKEPKIPVRIGIHMGDILYSKDDIIGDAVNIASRIESGAVPGSVLISDKIHDQIRNHRDIKVKFLDAYDLKNVEEVIPIFAIANAELVIPNRDEVKLQLKVKAKPKNKSLNKRKVIGVILAIAMLIFIINHFGLFASKQISSDKSIAVLPFENLSSDEDSEIFTDGITEAQNLKNEFYGTEQLVSFLSTADISLETTKILEKSVKHFEDFLQGRILKDDFTVILIKAK